MPEGEFSTREGSGKEMPVQQALDPVTREVIQNSLMSTADTMAVTVVRTARSAVVKHAMDFSTAMFTADGQQVAQGLTHAAHLGAMPPALEGVMNAFGDDVHPGDVFANNDPYEGASHLPDIFVFKPIFAYDSLVGWSCAIGHQVDIGGRLPGGNACDNTEIYQEGLRIPPIKLFERGAPNHPVWRILEKNVRVPEQVLGDVQALLAACRFGERDLLRMVDDYGVEEIKSYMADILDTTERLARAEIASMPQGEWEFTDYLDSSALDPDPIAIHVRLKIEGNQVYVDYDGTSPQARGSINPNLAYSKSMTYAPIKCVLSPGIQSNSGFFRCVNITAPEGCFVNPQHPAPVAARGVGGLRVCHVIFGALAQALPDRVPAVWGGGEVCVTFSGYHSNRKAWIYVEFDNDGPRGGGPFRDGADGMASPIANLANAPIESIEAEHPLLVDHYAFVPDTGGAGKFRGGLGMRRDFRMLAEGATFQLRSDRHDHLPWGVQGGQPGTPTQNHVNPDAENLEIPGKHLMALQKGDVYRLIQAGGGGYGDPLERDVYTVQDDVRAEKLSIDYVRRVYGVVIEPEILEVDLVATEELCADMRLEKREEMAS